MGGEGQNGLSWRESILDSIADGVFTVDGGWKITYFNRAAEQITGIPREQALGRPCHEVFKANICEEGCCLRETLKSGECRVHQAAYIVRGDGSRLPIDITTVVLKNEKGETVGGVETFRSLMEIETLREELKRRHTFHDIVSKNEKMQRLFDILPQVAFADSTVLLEGESGTGKELFARAIHELSHRKQKPLVTVNCGALPDTLLESELFGHKAGAFTGALRDRPGRFTLADGGTIFLDEIGDVSPALQVRLLRVLQEKTFEPLGSSRSEKADVRVIAATNRDLKKMVAEGSFREDLFYRINVINLKIPPLRERREDIPLLVDHFVEHFGRLKGKLVSGVSPQVMNLLMAHKYPGNIRELINIIEHACVLCPGGTILVEHLPEEIRPKELRRRQQQPLSLSQIETELIRDTLTRTGNSRSATARQLGIHPTTLWRKMKKSRHQGLVVESLPGLRLGRPDLDFAHRRRPRERAQRRGPGRLLAAVQGRQASAPATT